ncbi:MAG: ATP-binding protein, partial [Spirochaetota bacterium]
GTVNLGISAFSHSAKNRLLAASRISKDILQNESIRLIPEVHLELSKIKEILEDMLKSMDILVRHTRDLHLVMKPTQMEAVVKDTIERLKDLSDFKTSFTAKSCLAIIDKERIVEVLINVITNGVEAVPDGQRPEIRISLKNEDRWGIIQVEDNGPGIPPDLLERIFDPFETTKARITNWGFGLSYSFKIVSAHGGKIFAENCEEGGARFTIMLPVL